MIKTQNRNYKEVTLDDNGKVPGRFYRNPLTNVYQYEYALYLAVAELFSAVRSKSMCLDSLKLYFMELKDKGEEKGELRPGNEQETKKKTRQEVLSEVTLLVSRDVIGHVTFPMMSDCAAEVRTISKKDGTHCFIFTDRVYGFRVYLEMPEKGSHPRRVVVEDMSRDGRDRKPAKKTDFAALISAA